jgi:hypothetical protein
MKVKFKDCHLGVREEQHRFETKWTQKTCRRLSLKMAWQHEITDKMDRERERRKGKKGSWA